MNKKDNDNIDIDELLLEEPVQSITEVLKVDESIGAMVGHHSGSSEDEAAELPKENATGTNPVNVSANRKTNPASEVTESSERKSAKTVEAGVAASSDDISDKKPAASKKTPGGFITRIAVRPGESKNGTKAEHVLDETLELAEKDLEEQLLSDLSEGEALFTGNEYGDDNMLPYDRKHNNPNARASFGQGVLQQFLPALFLLWDEAVFHLFINRGIHDDSLLYIALFAVAWGFLAGTVGGFLKRKAQNIVFGIILGLVTVLFMTQTVYQGIFNNYLSLSVMNNAGDAAEFWREALAGIWDRVVLLLLLLVPVIVWIVMCKKGFTHRRISMPKTLLPLVLSAAACFAAITLMKGEKAHTTGRYDTFFKEWQADKGIKENGILVGLAQDVYLYFTYDPNEIGEVVLNNPEPIIPPIATPTPTVNLTPEPTRAPDNTPTPTPTPVDRSPHTLPIDFASLAANTTNKSIKTIHEYMASVEPVNKNEYTGMYEGYNLIVMTCETFSPLAVSEELTPTLYRLIHDGFYFENFYTPYWITSTSDGEYTACTGLLPDIQVANSFSRSSKNDMVCCLGHIFRGLGYTTYAFHDHDGNYYDRNKSHPNMGYNFIAVNYGLHITNQFPESDLEMMEQTIPMYINEDHFLAYYMTMSGHMGYDWADNAMGRKHRSEVQNLPYGEKAKCYIAANLELEAAMNYLLTELEEAGVLDHTLIVMSGDHYPYGLGEGPRNEIAGHKIDWEFELFENQLVIWNPKMTPTTVTKTACSLDIMPTLLNLMGVEYDSRLYMGTDILSDSLGLVQFKDNSFVTDYVMYNANNGKADWRNGAEEWDAAYKKQYIDSYKQIVKNKFNISRAMLNNNYYSTIKDKLWWMQN